MVYREKELKKELDQGTEFILLEGRDTIHKCSCNYIRESGRPKISVQSMKQMDGNRFCKRCCTNLLPNPYSMVIDLEMCRVNGKSEFGYSHEIIQIGAVMVDEAFEVVSEFSTYVCPEYGKLDSYITRLTGIEEANIVAAPSLEVAMKMFLSWMNHFKIEKIYAWSNNDYYQFHYELNHKKLSNKGLSDLLDTERWIDYQNVFGKRYGYGRAVSLEDALMYSQIYQVGRAHNGLDDALNTASLIQKLEMHPEFKPCVKSATKQNEDRLTFSLGDMMSRLLIQSEISMVSNHVM